ncbi:murein biosynthesis integral membrane protein MurJ [Candidatus Gracilibacteria bacterium]|nr:murein biosynthesis integral membrane protein MurJ [Candidatus Gracilibacteria bacterium]
MRIIVYIKKFFTGAGIISLCTLGSYIAGLIRDRQFAHLFGAGRELDIYNAAFIIPDLMLTIFVTSALSPAFIPLFTSLVTKKEKEQADQLGSTVIIMAVAVVVVLGLLCALFMPVIAPLIAPGFSGEEQKQLINLSRLLMLSPFLIALSSAFGAMLVSYKSFIAYGLSPMFYNIGIIGGTLLVPWLGIYGVVLGTLVGAFLHLLPRAISLRSEPFSFTGKVNIKDIHFRKMLKLMIPKLIGHPVEQLQFLSFTRIATLLAVGSVTAVSFARNFQSVGVSLIGISIAVASFPVLAAHWADKRIDQFKKEMLRSLGTILIITVPAAIGLYILSDIPIRIFLGGGKFSDENILLTAKILSAFALSIPFESAVHLLARAFYAQKNTVIPVALSVVGLVISVSYAFLKSPTSGAVAIAHGFALGSAAEAIILFIILWKRTPQLDKGGNTRHHLQR